MKILYLCADPGIPIRGNKGASVHVRALTDAFSDLGHSVVVLSPRGGPSNGPQLDARLIEVPAADQSTGNGEHAAQAAAESVYQAAGNLLAEEHFDLIYERYSLWSEAGARLAPEFGLPYIVEVNAPLLLEAARYRSIEDPQLAARIEAHVIKAASALIAVSEPLRTYLFEQGASPSKVHVIPNAVDERIFHPAVDGTRLRTRLGLSDQFIVGFVGTSRPWHDLETWIAAMAQLTSSSIRYHLLLVGEISSSVRAAIAAYGLTDRTSIVGPVPNGEIPSWLGAMDIAVSPHPPLPGFYFSPLKLFEYLACGKAVVAADVTPISQVLKDGIHGLLYAPGDAASLASRIDLLERDPALRASLGFQGAEHVLLHHTWKGNARKVLDLIARPHTPQRSKASAGEVPSLAPIWDEKIGVPLYRATRLDLAGEALSKHLMRTGRGEAIRLTGWMPLKYKPGHRCVIAYEYTGRDNQVPAQTIIGKVFRDRRGQEYLEVQRALWEGGFGAEAADRIAVAEPIAYVSEMNMLVQSRAPGSPFDQLLDLPGLEQRAALAAAAVAKLHDFRTCPRAAYSLEAELANLENWSAGLCTLRPDLASIFRLQLARLRSLAGDVPLVDPVPVHRDFHYGQLLFSGSLVTLIDLDLLALGDPAIDVANFAAHLEFLGIQFRQNVHALDGAKEAFVQAYLRSRPMPAAAQRLAFYEAATFFRLMFVALTRPPFTPFFEPLLEATDEKMNLVKTL